MDKKNDLQNVLDQLKETISKSNDLSESEKLDLSVDIESIKDQLAKAEPNKNIIGQLWSSLEKVAVVTGVVEAYNKVAPYIQQLLP